MGSGKVVPDGCWAAVLAVAVAVGCASGTRRSDPPVLVPWDRIGDIGLGDSKEHVLSEYGKQPELGYRRHGGKVQVGFDRGRVTSIWFSTRYYRTRTGLGVGSRIPMGPCHRTRTRRCERRWRGFVWNEDVREKPCGCWTKVGRSPQSLVTAKNFLKPWLFINVRRGRVSSFYLASRFVD